MMNSLQVCAFLVLAYVGLGTSTTTTATTTAATCPQADKCQNELEAALSVHNITQACKALDKSGNCFATLKNCPGRFQKVLDVAQINVTDDEMKTGCTGACAQAAEKCTFPVVSLLNGQTKYDLSLCGKITTMLQCLENLKTTECTKGVKAALKYFSKLSKENEFSDFCDDKGKASSCFKELNECMKNIAGITPTTDVKTACAAMDKYLQCETSDHCKSTLKSYKDSIRASMMTQERQAKCTAVGDCNDRVDKCGQDALTKMSKYANPDDHKAELCKAAKQAVTCFDFIKRDPTCVNVKAAVGAAETAVRKLDSKCGAASIVVSSALVMIGVLASFFKSV